LWYDQDYQEHKIYIGWMKPPTDWFYLNTDEASKDSN